MKTYIALFRGINVGGHHIIPMKELKSVLEGLSFTDVKTYIQSGNVVFRSSGKAEEEMQMTIKQAISTGFGFEPAVLIMEKSELEMAIKNNPFPEGETNPKTLHLFFMEQEPPAPDLQALHDKKKETENFNLNGRVFYLHAPEGIGRSKLVTVVEKKLGVPATARNWRTVRKIAEMAG